MSRREFLVAANAAAFLLFLESCSIGSLGRQAPSPSIPRGASAYEQALKLLRDAVRASPDHLAQRAAEVVATRDATKIVDFVRQRIAVLPPFIEYDDPATARRWGSAATLRGGQGTLRDRADLLAELLSQAGFKAQVQVAERPSTIALDGLYASRAVAFAPDRGRIDLARQVLRQGGFPAPGSQHAFAPGPDPAAAILAALPSEIQVARVRNDLLPQRVPVVAFEDGAKQRYAYAIEGAVIVDAAPSKLVSRDADAVHNITITVSAMCNPALGGSTPRGRIVDLVTASWPADQVVGRQVLVAFIPPQGAKAVLGSGLDALPLRVATLRLQGDVLGPASAVPTPGAGTPGAFGTVQVLSDADRASALARVASIGASANATAFTEVALELAVTDSTGSAVDGLDARSFAVKEQGTSVDSFTLYSNVKKQQRPRVLIVYDGYVAFAPNLFKTEADKSAFEASLASAIAAQAAKTPFDVQVVGLGVAPDPQGWAPPDAGRLSIALAAAREIADDPWGTAGGPALAQGATAIVLVTDMNASDTDPARIPTYQRRVIASRLPVLVLAEGPIHQSTPSPDLPPRVRGSLRHHLLLTADRYAPTRRSGDQARRHCPRGPGRPGRRSRDQGGGGWGDHHRDRARNADERGDAGRRAVFNAHACAGDPDLEFRQPRPGPGRTEAWRPPYALRAPGAAPAGELGPRIRARAQGRDLPGARGLINCSRGARGPGDRTQRGGAPRRRPARRFQSRRCDLRRGMRRRGGDLPSQRLRAVVWTSLDRDRQWGLRGVQRFAQHRAARVT